MTEPGEPGGFLRTWGAGGGRHGAGQDVEAGGGLRRAGERGWVGQGLGIRKVTGGEARVGKPERGARSGRMGTVP